MKRFIINAMTVSLVGLCSVVMAETITIVGQPAAVTPVSGQTNVYTIPSNTTLTNGYYYVSGVNPNGNNVCFTRTVPKTLTKVNAAGTYYFVVSGKKTKVTCFDSSNAVFQTTTVTP